MQERAADEPDVCSRLNRSLAQWLREGEAHFLVQHDSGRRRKNLKA